MKKNPMNKTDRPLNKRASLRSASVTIRLNPATRDALRARAAAGKTSVSATAAGMIVNQIQAEAAASKDQPLY